MFSITGRILTLYGAYSLIREFYMYFYILILLFILLFQVSSSGPNISRRNILQRTLNCRSADFFTLVIVYHHLSQYLDNPGPFRVFLEVGILCVAAFFFYSGYGLMKSVLTNKNYFHHFFLRRYIKILFPFYLQCPVSFCLLSDGRPLWPEAVP